MRSRSQDIYHKIPELMVREDNLQKTYFSIEDVMEDYFPLLLEDKEEVMAKYLTALVEYTNLKLIEMGETSKEVVDDFPSMLDKLGELLPGDENREFFYQHFTHSALYMMDSLEDHNTIWRAEAKEDGEEYPRFVKRPFGVDFVTDIEVSNKDTAIWIYNYIKNVYLKGKSFKKDNRQ